MRSLGAREVIAFTLVLACVATAACKKSAPPQATASTTSASALASGNPAQLAGAGESPRFSLPIAAALGDDDHVLVAGLVAADHTLRLVDVGRDLKARFAVDVMRDVEWTEDAQLRVTSNGRAHVVAFRGVVGKKRVALASLVDASGVVVQTTQPVASMHCIYGENITMLSEKKEVTFMSLRTLEKRTMKPKIGDRDASLFCDGRETLLVGESEGASDFVSITLPHADAVLAAESGKLPAPGSLAMVFSDRELGTESREQTALYARESGAGFLRVGDDRELVFRAHRNGAADPAPVVRGEKLGAEEDVVHADASPTAVVVVTVSDTARECDGGAASTHVRALQMPLVAGGDKGKWTDIAPASCTREHGPYFSGVLGEGTSATSMVYFAERGRRPAKTVAPISSVAFHVFKDGEVTHDVPVSADGVVDAGCRGGHCYVVALLRPEGMDDSQPEPIRILSLP